MVLTVRVAVVARTRVVSASVGQTASHIPQNSQVLSCIGPSAPKPIRASAPRPKTPMAVTPFNRSQARTQRQQRMQAPWSTRMNGFDSSTAAGGRATDAGAVTPWRAASASNSLGSLPVPGR